MRTRELSKLSSFFEQYKKRLVAPERVVLEAFVEVVADLYGFQVKKEQIRYTPSTKTVAIIGGGPIRAEIKIHEEEILTHLKGRLGNKNAPTQIL